MERILKGLLYSLFLLMAATYIQGQYTPDWNSLDSRPLPSWFDDAKVGIFLHWGIFSVPSFKSEWFWKDWHDGNPECVQFMKRNYRPGFTYADFAPSFTAEFFEPDWWADLFEDSGARYVVLTTKHHEGYTLWPSNVSFSWNSVDVGPNRDLVGDLGRAVRRKNLHYGLYHSMFEFYNPIYLQDKANGFNTSTFPSRKSIPELKELVQNYRPDLLWSDGDWEAPDSYWTSKEFLAWLYNESPVKDKVVVNDRWGIGTLCQHGGYLTCQDKYQPHQLQKRKWENAMTLDKSSWGFRREAHLSDYLTPSELIQTLMQTVAYGGNLLVNIGPTHDGRILPIFEERLRAMGQWLRVNGEAIYGSQPWKVAQNDSITTAWYTLSHGYVYVLVPTYPKDNIIQLGCLPKPLNVTLLGYDKPLQFGPGKMGAIHIKLPLMQEAPSTSNLGIVLKATLPKYINKYFSCV